jgi:hypothetical protein
LRFANDFIIRLHWALTQSAITLKLVQVVSSSSKGRVIWTSEGSPITNPEPEQLDFMPIGPYLVMLAVVAMMMVFLTVVRHFLNQEGASRSGNAAIQPAGREKRVATFNNHSRRAAA